MDDERPDDDESSPPDEGNSGIIRAVASSDETDGDAADAARGDATGDGVSPGPLNELPRGATIGAYVILSRISDAPFETLYAAFDPQLDRKIALKIVEVTGEDEELAQTRRDALVEAADNVSHVEHPGVVEIFDVGTVGNAVYVAMEYVDGIDLRQWMEARDDPFPWPEVLRVFRSAGRGLAAAHAAGCVHGDFTPGRVLLGKQGRVCVFDFGLALPVDDPEADLTISDLREAIPGTISGLEDSLREMPAARERAGTPGYMAPEQHAGVEADPKADQFAFCAAMYEALYGEPPFRGQSAATLAVAAMSHNVRAAPEDSTVPPWLRAVLLRGLSPRRRDRFPSMEALLRLLEHDPVGRRRRWLGGVGLLVGVAAAAGGVAYLLQFESGRCEADEALLAGVWDTATRRDLEESFLASGSPNAAETWTSVQTSVDDWSQQWLEYRALACRLRAADDDEALMLRRNACLDGVLEPVASFADLYTQTTPELVDGAQRAVASLPRPSECASTDMHEYAVPADDEQGRMLARAVDQSWILMTAGQPERARGKALEARDRISADAHPALHVRASLVAGLASAAAGHPTAKALLHDAAAKAAAEQLRIPQAQAWLALAQAETPSTQTLWLDYAQALLDELRNDRLRAALWVTRGRVARARSQDRDALSAYHRALALLEPSHASAMVVRGDVLLELGQLTSTRAEWSSAERYLSQVIESRSALFGASHPELIGPLLALAHTHEAQGDSQQNAAVLERARELAKASTRHDAELIRIHLALGRLALSTNDFSGARSNFEAAQDSLAGTLADEALTAEALVGQGRALVASGSLAKAVAPLQRADQLHRRLHTSSLSRAPTWEALSLALADTDPTRSAEYRADALAAFRDGGEQNAADVARVLAQAPAPLPGEPENPE